MSPTTGFVGGAAGQSLLGHVRNSPGRAAHFDDLTGLRHGRAPSYVGGLVQSVGHANILSEIAIFATRSYPESMTGIPERVRELIQSAGSNQRDIAAEIGLDATKLSKSLSGARRFTSVDLGIWPRSSTSPLTGSSRARNLPWPSRLDPPGEAPKLPPVMPEI